MLWCGVLLCCDWVWIKDIFHIILHDLIPTNSKTVVNSLVFYTLSHSSSYSHTKLTVGEFHLSFKGIKGYPLIHGRKNLLKSLQRNCSFFHSRRTLLEWNRRTIKDLYIHPKWDQVTTNNDLALIRLDRPATLNNRVNTICLPEDEYQFSPPEQNAQLVVGVPPRKVVTPPPC